MGGRPLAFYLPQGNDSRTACRAKGPHGYAGAKARVFPPVARDGRLAHFKAITGLSALPRQQRLFKDKQLFLVVRGGKSRRLVRVALFTVNPKPSSLYLTRPSYHLDCASSSLARPGALEGFAV